eukprot:10577144-Prorocentrum_lima.AAC.1
MASSSTAVPKPAKTKFTGEDAEARERSIKGWVALRALEKRQFAFSWWPGQESEVIHTQTRLSGNREGLFVDIGAYDNLM